MLKLGIPHTWGLGSKLASRLEDIGMTPNLAFFWQHMKQMEDEFQMDHAGTLLYGFTMYFDTF